MAVLRPVSDLIDDQRRRIGEADLVAAAGDRRLVDAWTFLGVATFDPNRPG